MKHLFSFISAGVIFFQQKKNVTEIHNDWTVTSLDLKIQQLQRNSQNKSETFFPLQPNVFHARNFKQKLSVLLTSDSAIFEKMLHVTLGK